VGESARRLSRIARLPIETGRLGLPLSRVTPYEGQSVTASPSHDHEVFFLDADGLDATLEAELARAARHELPLALVLLEVSGPGLSGATLRGRVEQAVVAGLRERVRAEDRAAQLGPLKFAVIGVETDESDALASGLAEQVKHSLTRLGPEAAQLVVVTGAVDCQYDEVTRDELIEEAERALSAAHTGFLRKSA
jgi:GGDEF domain-containing protein